MFERKQKRWRGRRRTCCSDRSELPSLPSRVSRPRRRSLDTTGSRALGAFLIVPGPASTAKEGSAGISDIVETEATSGPWRNPVICHLSCAGGFRPGCTGSAVPQSRGHPSLWELPTCPPVRGLQGPCGRSR